MNNKIIAIGVIVGIIVVFVVGYNYFLTEPQQNETQEENQTQEQVVFRYCNPDIAVEIDGEMKGFDYQFSPYSYSDLNNYLTHSIRDCRELDYTYGGLGTIWYCYQENSPTFVDETLWYCDHTVTSDRCYVYYLREEPKCPTTRTETGLYYETI